MLHNPSPPTLPWLIKHWEKVALNPMIVGIEPTWIMLPSLQPFLSLFTISLMLWNRSAVLVLSKILPHYVFFSLLDTFDTFIPLEIIDVWEKKPEKRKGRQREEKERGKVSKPEKDERSRLLFSVSLLSLLLSRLHYLPPFILQWTRSTSAAALLQSTIVVNNNLIYN